MVSFKQNSDMIWNTCDEIHIKKKSSISQNTVFGELIDYQKWIENKIVKKRRVRNNLKAWENT